MTVAAPPWRVKQPAEGAEGAEGSSQDKDAPQGTSKFPPMPGVGFPGQNLAADMTTAKSKSFAAPQDAPRTEPPGGFPSKAAPWESTVPKAKASPDAFPPAAPDGFAAAAVSKASAVVQ
jgi:hypothetical protein